jgi:Raf kinase inhibitor-like YbhB/YbcL family protein
MAFRLSSPAFKAGGRIPPKYSCEGADISPPLAWTGAPAGTRSFVLLCDDPDAPVGAWHHWALFNLPTAVGHLDEAYPATGRLVASRQAINDFGKPGYGGPCPPRGHGTHHYRFRLLALSVPSLALPEPVKCVDVENAAKPFLLGTAQLIGTYSR